MKLFFQVTMALIVGSIVLGTAAQAEANAKRIACYVSDGGIVSVAESSKSKTGYVISYRPEGSGGWGANARDVEIDNESDLETLRGATLVNLFASGIDCRLEIQNLGKRDGATFTCEDQPSRHMSATCEVETAGLGE